MTAETIAKALGGRKAGSGWTTRCPAHDDRTPSLSIRDAEGNKVDGRPPGRNIPAVERPEMHAGAEALADEAQPGNPCMGGFRHRSLHVEVKHRFRAARALLGQTPPAGIAHTRRAVAETDVSFT